MTSRPSSAPERLGGEDARSVIRSLVGPVYAPTLIEASGSNALLPVIPLLALALGFSVPMTAAITLVFGIAAVLGPIPSGRLMDRVGAQRALVGTGVVLVITNLVALVVIGRGLAEGPTLVHRVMLVVLLVVMATSSQVWALGRQSYLGGALPAAVRARGMTLFGGMMRIGQVVGPLLGAGVTALGHESWVFALFAVLSGAATIMVAVFMVPGEGRRAPRANATAGGAAGRSRGAPARADAPRRSAARSRLTRGVLARMLVVGLGITPLMMARVNRPTIVPLLGAVLGVDATTISIIFGVSAVLDIALVVPAGVLMDRFGRAAVAVPCSLIMGAGFVLMGVLALRAGTTGGSVAVLALLIPSLLISLGNGLGSGIVMTLGIDVSPVHGRTTYLAWWNTMIGVGRLTAPLLVTVITLLAPVAAAAIASGVLCLGGGAWLARVLPRHTPAPEPRRG
ncbi:MFS transporter [Brachybacterium kimchii]|uniref:MFS transporter n=1 Tax=Brachybacterium kimchii TaxID=2942909 RepID=A0ABY4N9Z7_9MICO|nr:MFS transporter [Brachybacterium kimchii]UQN31383.1 MFS transporter [Brachybacterium kimchii]